MAWEITGSLGPEGRAGYDASGWLWEIRKEGEEPRRVLVEITGSARAVHENGAPLPSDTQEAIRTEGRSAVEEVVGLPDPPRVIQCGTNGCHPE
jgi:hypothetical protein